MNLPTKITIARIALIPIFVLFFCLHSVFEQFYIPMTIVFIIASCTDFIDGYIARKHNLVTDLGKFLDPIADKILVVAGMIILLKMNFVTSTGEVYPVLAPYFGEICVILILAREFIIGVFRQLAASKGFVMAADKLGKAKTITTLIALPMLMLVPLINEPWHKAVNWIGVVFLFLGWVLFGIATLLTVISGINYIWKNKGVLVADKVKAESNPTENVADKMTDNSDNIEFLTESVADSNRDCAKDEEIIASEEEQLTDNNIVIGTFDETIQSTNTVVEEGKND